ncbi:MAG: TlpA disulfide reductase family protein [Xanthomonadales bacterium]|nr:TlpA disulfide reductase family protein [Xanthomonadales bacterium]
MVEFFRRLPGAMVLLLATAAGAEESPAEPIEFSIGDINGMVIDMADYRNQWVVVNFWATWCKPCRKEIPFLDAIHRERDDVTVIGLAFEEVGPEEIKAFLVDYPATYPIALIDVYEPPDTFGVPRVLPTTVIVDPSGRRAETFLGPVERHDIENFIDGEPTDD